MEFHSLKPYNQLPPLPPGNDIETRPVLRKAISAARALAELNGVAETITGHESSLDFLLILEAQANCEIENIFTSKEDLFRSFLDEPNDTATREVLRCRQALSRSCRALQEGQVISTALFVEILRLIKPELPGIRIGQGMRIIDYTSGKIVYCAPEGEAVIQEKLRRLCDFIHADDHMDPLIKLGLIHYQFEAIHPFADGNGRAGRIINVLYLIQNKLLNFPGFCMSVPIIKKQRDYYRLLLEVTTKGAWEPWLLYMLDVVTESAHFTQNHIITIHRLMQDALEKARGEVPAGVDPRALVALAFKYPYISELRLVEAGIASLNSAPLCLAALAKTGILRAQKHGATTLYINQILHGWFLK